MNKPKARQINPLWQALRPSHWTKNLVVFLPLIFAQKVFFPPDQLRALVAFTIFCVAASAGYLFNDCIDQSLDQNHPFKKNRPIAKGRLSVRNAKVAIISLVVLALVGAYFLTNIKFFGIVIIYFVLNGLYSSWLKNIVIVDVMILASFYIIRILGGLIVLNVRISHWMIICIWLLALFIGLNKRRHELLITNGKITRKIMGKYSRYFVDQMIGVVTAATVMSYTLYTVDVDTVSRIGHHHMIWTIPFVYYGIFRYLYLVHKRRKGGDPVRIFISDKRMILNVTLWALCSAVIINL